MTLLDYKPRQTWYVSQDQQARAGLMIDLDLIEHPDTGELVPDSPYDAYGSLHPEWWRLEGTVQSDGCWVWDGEGDPRDWNGNTVEKLKAFK